LFQLELFKEELPFKALKPSQASGNRMTMGYQGNPKDVKIEVKKAGVVVPIKVTQLPKKDSLQIWFPPIKNDSLGVSIVKNGFTDNHMVKIKDQKKDTLSISSTAGADLAFRKKFGLISAIPLTAIDASKITLLNKDSVKVNFTTTYDEWKQEVVFDFEKQPMEKYKLTAFPGALTDYYDKKNDTLTYTFSTRNTSDYGNLRVILERIQRYPLIVEITDEKGAVIEREVVYKDTKVFFDLIEPKKYTLRVIYDDNKNGVWDAGNFIEKRQSEEVIYFGKEIDVRANWDVEQPFDIGTK
jgi:hypothetical protein